MKVSQIVSPPFFPSSKTHYDGLGCPCSEDRLDGPAVKVFASRIGRCGVKSRRVIPFTFHLSPRLCPSSAGCSPPLTHSIVFCLLFFCSRWFLPSLLCRLAIFCVVVLSIPFLSLVATVRSQQLPDDQRSVRYLPVVWSYGAVTSTRAGWTGGQYAVTW